MEKWVTLSPTKQAKYVKIAKQKRRRRSSYKPKSETEQKVKQKKKNGMSDEEAEYEPPTRIKKQTEGFGVKEREQAMVEEGEGGVKAEISGQRTN